MDINKLQKLITSSFIALLGIFATITVLYFIWFYLINDFQHAKDGNAWGVFGDFLGGVLNPLVALFAFYWLAQSVLIQKEELNKTRKALEEAKNAQKEQVATAAETIKIEKTAALLNCINANLAAKLNYRNILLENYHKNNVVDEVKTENGSLEKRDIAIGECNKKINELLEKQNQLIAKIL